MVIGSPGAWFTDPRIGINYTKLVNAGVSAAFHAPMPASGEVVGRSRVIALADKGVASGALLIFRRQLHERQSGLHLCDIDTTYLCRGDGGFGGPNVDAPAPHQLPETKPELTVEFRTLAQLALIYRLSGDRNPLHADPAVAVAAGFPQPILHGLCTFGVVGYVALTAIDALGGGDPSAKVWELAKAEPRRLVDMVEALPLVSDPGVRTSLYDRVLPLVDGLPGAAAVKPGTVGRFVRVELPGTQRTLTLAEVEIYAGDDNLARYIL